MSDWFTDKCYRKQYTLNRARGVYYNGKTYVTFQGPDSDPLIMTYDHSSKTWSSEYLVGESVIDNSDDHGNPGMCIDAHGRIHVIYGGHGLASGEMMHRVSKNPEDITSWQNGGTLPEDSTNNLSLTKSTYPGLFKLDNGTLILICRGPNLAGGGNTHKAHWYCTVSTTNGISWDAPVAFLEGTENQSPDDAWYAYGQAKGNELHVGFCHHQCGDGPAHQAIRTNIYYIKRNSQGTWVNVQGNSLPSLPLKKSDADNVSNKIIVYNSHGAQTQYPSVDVDNNGTPFLSFGKEESGGVVKYCANWNGSNWNVRTVASHVNNEQTRTVILYRGGNTFSLFCFGNNGQDLLEYKTTDGNNNWSSQTTIWSGEFDDPCILWQPNNNAYLFFDDDVAVNRHGYLYGDSGFVGNNEASIIYECENLSRNANVQTLVINDLSARSGQWIKLDSHSVNDWIEFVINVPTGSYSIEFQGKQWSGRGQFQLSIDGINQGTTIDQYGTPSSYQKWNLGNKTFDSTSDYTFRFTCVGKSANANDFTGSFDYISLIRSTRYECENLSRNANVQDPNVQNEVEMINDPSAGSGQWIKLNSNAINDWIEFVINVPAGTHRIKFQGKTWSRRGQFQLSIDGVNQGTIIDQYGTPSGYQEWDLGDKTFDSTSDYTFRFTCVGKSTNSSDFTGSFDYINID